MDCACPRGSEPSCGCSAPSPSATWAFLLHLQEATGDSECHDDLPEADVAFDNDDGGDAESCSGAGAGAGAGDDHSVELDAGRRLLSWERWMTTESAKGVVLLGGEAACLTYKEEETAADADADADSDRLFWEACIAHGY